jgi:hypothetical protein
MEANGIGRISSWMKQRHPRIGSRDAGTSRKGGRDQYSTEIVLCPYSGNLIMLDSRKDELSDLALPEQRENQEAAA